jgi:hypothetical protein
MTTVADDANPVRGPFNAAFFTVMGGHLARSTTLKHDQRRPFTDTGVWQRQCPPAGGSARSLNQHGRAGKTCRPNPHLVHTQIHKQPQLPTLPAPPSSYYRCRLRFALSHSPLGEPRSPAGNNGNVELGNIVGAYTTSWSATATQGFEPFQRVVLHRSVRHVIGRLNVAAPPHVSANQELDQRLDMQHALFGEQWRTGLLPLGASRRRTPLACNRHGRPSVATSRLSGASGTF